MHMTNPLTLLALGALTLLCALSPAQAEKGILNWVSYDLEGEGPNGAGTRLNAAYGMRGMVELGPGIRSGADVIRRMKVVGEYALQDMNALWKEQSPRPPLGIPRRVSVFFPGDGKVIYVHTSVVGDLKGILYIGAHGAGVINALAEGFKRCIGVFTSMGTEADCAEMLALQYYGLQRDDMLNRPLFAPVIATWDVFVGDEKDYGGFGKITKPCGMTAVAYKVDPKAVGREREVQEGVSARAKAAEAYCVDLMEKLGIQWCSAKKDRVRYPHVSVEKIKRRSISGIDKREVKAKAKPAPPAQPAAAAAGSAGKKATTGSTGKRADAVPVKEPKVHKGATIGVPPVVAPLRAGLKAPTPNVRPKAGTPQLTDAEIADLMGMKRTTCSVKGWNLDKSDATTTTTPVCARGMRLRRRGKTDGVACVKPAAAKPAAVVKQPGAAKAPIAKGKANAGTGAKLPGAAR
ncbi:hypothetical protein DFH27DRAFT_526407 [Peziza echinospora]|nr:hypothetical protein DFH27DRAFT_526407 [Peziza echinospora]